MNLHEYQARDILRRHGIPVPPGEVASTPAEAAPANMPKKLMLDSNPASAVESWKVCLIEPSTNVSAPRSMLSKNHAVAMIAKIAF